MIRQLRRKFIFILMCVASLILLAVFASMLISTSSNSRRMSDAMLRQALAAPPNMQGVRPPPAGEGRETVAAELPGLRTPILIAEIGPDGQVAVLVHQLHFMDADQVKEAVLAAARSGKVQGTLADYGLRWRMSDDGSRIALADISMEREVLKNLIVNALLIGGVSLAAFFILSLFLSRWTVRPVEAAWQRQRQFVADASHELKTPLTVILSNAGMLSADGVFTDEKKARRMERVLAEATRMKTLVEDLLVLAKSDSAELARVQAQVDLSFVVTSAVLTFEPAVFDARKELSYHVEDSLFVTGDAQRLQQLAGIFLDNAVKYSPPGGNISVSLKKVEKKTALLSVLTDGAPLSPKELTQVFERFYRADKARSAPGSYGLGLSIAQSIVEEHHGKIWADSKEGTGNCFYAKLPLAESTIEKLVAKEGRIWYK